VAEFLNLTARDTCGYCLVWCC